MDAIHSIALAAILLGTSVLAGALIADAISTLMGWKK